MGKHCLQLVLILLPLFSPYARRFSEQTDEKNPCWAVFSVIFKMADTTNACMLPTRLVSCTESQTSEPISRTWGVLLLCNILYRVSCHDICIWIGIVSWKNVSLQAYFSTYSTLYGHFVEFPEMSSVNFVTRLGWLDLNIFVMFLLLPSLSYSVGHTQKKWMPYLSRGSIIKGRSYRNDTYAFHFKFSQSRVP